MKKQRQRKSSPRNSTDLLAVLAVSVLAGLSVPSNAADKAPAADGVSASTAPAKAATDAFELPQSPTTIEQVYNGTGLRDPFIPLVGSGGGGGGGSGETSSLPPPSIHNMVLKGILSGKLESLAMIEDSSTGARYILKGSGKLFDVTGKPVPGITGSIKTAKSVLVTTTADNDVQWLQMVE